MNRNLENSLHLQPVPNGGSPGPTEDTPSLSQALHEALAPVSAEMAELELRLTSYLPIETRSAKEVCDHFFAQKGKRIRPALYFFSAHLFEKQGEHHYPIAAVCEFVHTASLLHDDVVDSSTLRRNKPTANSIWGDETSVLVGDLAYSTASEMMASTGSLEIVKSFARAIRLMSEGELMQLENVFHFHLSESAYFRTLECKTGELIGTSCQAAAILADATSAEKEALYQFGKNLGIAFQLVDDSLDYLGAREIFGKKNLSDLEEGKVTLPLILAREKMTNSERELCHRLFSQSELSQENRLYVASLVEKYETAVQTINAAETYTKRAIDALGIFSGSPWQKNMVALAEQLVWRSV